MIALGWLVGCVVIGVVGGLVHSEIDARRERQRFEPWVADENAKDRALGLVGEDAP